MINSYTILYQSRAVVKYNTFNHLYIKTLHIHILKQKKQRPYQNGKISVKMKNKQIFQ